MLCQEPSEDTEILRPLPQLRGVEMGSMCEGTSIVAQNGSPLPGLPSHDMSVTCILLHLHPPLQLPSEVLFSSNKPASAGTHGASHTLTPLTRSPR